MPKILELLNGYIVTIWSNEQGEPIHVHVCKGRASKASTKFWLLSNRSVLRANNGAKMSEIELHRVHEQLMNNWEYIVAVWYQYHGYLKFYM